MNLKMVGLITNYLRNARFKGAVRAILFRGDLILARAGQGGSRLKLLARAAGGWMAGRWNDAARR